MEREGRNVIEMDYKKTTNHQNKQKTEKVELKCFMGVKAIRSRAGRMKEQKWRASRGERQGRSQGRETESVARSR